MARYGPKCEKTYPEELVTKYSLVTVGTPPFLLKTIFIIDFIKGPIMEVFGSRQQALESHHLNDNR